MVMCDDEFETMENKLFKPRIQLNHNISTYPYLNNPDLTVSKQRKDNFVQFQNISIPPPWRVIRNSEGEGVRATFTKESTAV